MPRHSDLTGTDLHEPKGVAGANANEVYKADGGTSGSWGKVGADSLDTDAKPTYWIRFNGEDGFNTQPILASGTIIELMLHDGNPSGSGSYGITLRNNSVSSNAVYTFSDINRSTYSTETVDSGLSNTAVTKGQFLFAEWTDVRDECTLYVKIRES